MPQKKRNPIQIDDLLLFTPPAATEFLRALDAASVLDPEAVVALWEYASSRPSQPLTAQMILGMLAGMILAREYGKDKNHRDKILELLSDPLPPAA